MGYLDNSSVIVDAILTRKGRELLAQGNFNISQFALADDEIDYTLYNENHPSGTNYYGEAIENLPLLEAIPNENNIMVSKLISLDAGSTAIPVLSVASTITQNRQGTVSINPTTNNLIGTSTNKESAYAFTVGDRRLFQTVSTSGGSGGTSITIPYSGTALSQTVVGQTFNGTLLAGTSLFGNNSALSTTITVVGIDTGARATITLTVLKVLTGTTGGENAVAST
jgi:hypothetical protein